MFSFKIPIFALTMGLFITFLISQRKKNIKIQHFRNIFFMINIISFMENSRYGVLMRESKLNAHKSKDSAIHVHRCNLHKISKNWHFNPFTPSGLFYNKSLDQSISNRWGAWTIFIINMLLEMPVFNANIVDSDQTPRPAASDLDLHCLPMPLLRNARLKWVNNQAFTPNVFSYCQPS